MDTFFKKTKSISWMLIILFLSSTLSASSSKQMGKDAPDFTLNKLMKSGTVSLSALRGKVVLIDFWATWCPPCKKSLPLLDALDAKYRNLKVVAINIDDDKENARAFLKQFKLKINAVYDEGKKIVELYDVPVMPTAYLVDQYGKIQYVHSGYNEKSMKKLEFTIRGLVDQH